MSLVKSDWHGGEVCRRLLSAFFWRGVPPVLFMPPADPCHWFCARSSSWPTFHLSGQNRGLDSNSTTEKKESACECDLYSLPGPSHSETCWALISRYKMVTRAR